MNTGFLGCLPMVVSWGIRSGGSRFRASCSVAPLAGASESGGIYSCVVRDLTESWVLENILRAQGKSLQEEVQTQAVALSKVNKDFENFSHLIGHDFRAPLRHIRGYAQLLKESKDVGASAAYIKHVEDIERLTGKMTAMVDALLEYTRLGNERMDFVRVDVGQLFSATIGHYKALSGGRHIHWVVGQSMPIVRGDPTLMGEVFSRLIDNAVKFTGKTAEAIIEVGVHELSASRCVIFIKDNGVGFDVTQAPNLYLLFQRQHHTMDFQGLGAGLAISQRIIEKHGGSIRCESSRNVGCTFFIDLPLWRQAHP